ncbi:MarR family winged helix-turn-helix transcriptional regulator [Chitinasiproducens palmae]|uniref:DNA-binding transcriptional regulator, MarR family n=1 Tax=Chitinasiproducens palmae TaxID=1770053 RepID=A0A1H2PJ19_9BURK|nr:MarR family transcriptional regulator [Chitinasiproducens palmae]SDV46338.1 DNA-binding transcriptional regulator, MarR family [Chitinasiproducens palmae]
MPMPQCGNRLASTLHLRLNQTFCELLTPEMSRIDDDNGISETGAVETGHLWQRPGFLIRRLNQIHVALFFESCKDFAITPVQYGLLTTLSERPNLDQTSLCAEVGVDRTTMADVLRRLEERGLVKREPSPTDGRLKIANITARGRKIMKEMYASMRESQVRFLSPLSAQDQTVFVRLMMQLVEGNNQFGRTSLKHFD